MVVEELKPPTAELREAALSAAISISELVNAGGSLEDVAMSLAYLVTFAIEKQHAAGRGEAKTRADIERWALCRHDILRKDCRECGHAEAAGNSSLVTKTDQERHQAGEPWSKPATVEELRAAGAPAPTLEQRLRAVAKPRITVKRFANELKARISKVMIAFAGNAGFVSGAQYIQGVVDALLSDYDVRDAEDFMRSGRVVFTNSEQSKRDQSAGAPHAAMRPEPVAEPPSPVAGEPLEDCADCVVVDGCKAAHHLRAENTELRMKLTELHGEFESLSQSFIEDQNALASANARAEALEKQLASEQAAHGQSEEYVALLEVALQDVLPALEKISGHADEGLLPRIHCLLDTGLTPKRAASPSEPAFPVPDPQNPPGYICWSCGAPPKAQVPGQTDEQRERNGGSVARDEAR